MKQYNQINLRWLTGGHPVLGAISWWIHCSVVIVYVKKHRNPVMCSEGSNPDAETKHIQTKKSELCSSGQSPQHETTLELGYRKQKVFSRNKNKQSGKGGGAGETRVPPGLIYASRSPTHRLRNPQRVALSSTSLPKASITTTWNQRKSLVNILNFGHFWDNDIPWSFLSKVRGTPPSRVVEGVYDRNSLSVSLSRSCLVDPTLCPQSP